ncbi:MAG TPA: hypothetical protein VL284_06390 [Thermoanaerobaculia bacterium]|nr:hypothetical protein [Thermoanaerobaculia bacterium]
MTLPSHPRKARQKFLSPKLVCEVEHDDFSQGRFRHGSKFSRWRPDKSPRECTMEQVTNDERGTMSEEPRSLAR